MEKIVIYKPANVPLFAFDGEPPVDQSAQIAALEAQVVEFTLSLEKAWAERDEARAERDALRQQVSELVVERENALAAAAALQAKFDALNTGIDILQGQA
jgi:uncharacterized coiled-coil DUF342 family protein